MSKQRKEYIARATNTLASLHKEGLLALMHQVDLNIEAATADSVSEKTPAPLGTIMYFNKVRP